MMMTMSYTMQPQYDENIAGFLNCYKMNYQISYTNYIAYTIHNHRAQF